MTGKALPKDLNAEWAWSQIEACADDSLRGRQRARMREAMARDPMLAAAVARARAVRTALGSARAEPVPARLRARLLAIGHSRPIAWRAVGVAALGVASVLLLAVLVLRPVPVAETPDPAPQIAAHEEAEQAIEEFRIAMRYLRIGAERSGEQVGDALATSLRLALATSHDSLREHFGPDQNESHESNGG